MLIRLCRLLASLKLAVILIVLLAGVLATATFLEAVNGREYAQWYVYDSPWFFGLLAILGLNILAATLVRFPWQRRQIGFVVTHAGLLVLLAGSMQTFFLGVEGQLSLREGEQSDRFMVTDRSLITAKRAKGRGTVSTQFSFHAGPVDWTSDRELDFGELDGFGLRVLRFIRHAREWGHWVADDADYEGAVLELSLLGPDDQVVARDWLAASPSGGQVTIGATKYTLLPLSDESMVEEFLEPPTQELGTRGVLAIHHEGRRELICVDEHVGDRVPVGRAEMEVEILEYLPNAKPTAMGKFVSAGDRPENPLLELRIHQSDSPSATRQIAFAKLPLLNLDAVHGGPSPIKFWYHHPHVTVEPGAVFMQAPSGRLYCRTVVGGALQSPREVRSGDRVSLGAQFSVVLGRHIPKARQEVNFAPVELAPGEANPPEAAALVEVTSGDVKRLVWLKRNDAWYGTRRILGANGPIVLSFGYQSVPLGFQLSLDQFTRELNPGRMGNAGFASTVQVVDAAKGIDRRHRISMNQPLAYGKYRFYQSSFQELPGGAHSSVLAVANDPGRFLKYAGSLMICGGIFIMFSMRSYVFKRVPRLRLVRKRPSVAADVALAGRSAADTVDKAA